MGANLKRKHEGLANYLQPLGAPGDVRVVGLQPRQPVAPAGQVPGGFNPIPTSSQGPKRTNATIVYARTAVADTRKLGRIGLFFKEGDLVFTQRLKPALKDPLGQNVKVTSMQLLNRDLQDVGPMDTEEADKFLGSRDPEKAAFKWSPDGVVNNLDGDDPENQYKDFAIANVAIQGFVRFSTLPFGAEARGHNFPKTFISQKGVRNGDRVYLALVSESAGENKRRYRFEYFLASHVTLGKLKDEGNIEKVWRLGRVVDGNQSKNMVTLCVGVEAVSLESVSRAWS